MKLQIYSKGTGRFLGISYIVDTPYIRQHHTDLGQGCVLTDIDIVESRLPPIPPSTETTVIYKIVPQKLISKGLSSDILMSDSSSFHEEDRIGTITALLLQGGLIYDNLTANNKGVIVAFTTLGVIGTITDIGSPMPTGDYLYESLGLSGATLETSSYIINEVMSQQVVFNQSIGSFENLTVKPIIPDVGGGGTPVEPTILPNKSFLQFNTPIEQQLLIEPLALPQFDLILNNNSTNVKVDYSIFYECTEGVNFEVYREFGGVETKLYTGLIEGSRKSAITTSAYDRVEGDTPNQLRFMIIDTNVPQGDVTYRLKLSRNDEQDKIWINRSKNDTNSSETARGVSVVTAEGGF